MTPRLVASGVGVRGLVYVDGNDSPNHLIERAWPKLADTPIRAVMAPPSPCHRQGQLADWLRSRRPGSVEVVDGAGHGDIEMLGAGVYRWACGDVGNPATWLALQSSVLGAVCDLLVEP